MIAVLQVVFYLTWKYNKEIREMIRYEERCSECTMLIKGMPEGKFTEEDLLKLFQYKLNGEEELENVNSDKVNQSDLEQQTCEIILLTNKIKDSINL